MCSHLLSLTEWLLTGQGTPGSGGHRCSRGPDNTDRNLAREKAARRIDAKGLVVTPGFIDIHTHSDLALVVDGRAEAHILQGVTTSVTGNCGTSAAPATEDTLSLMASIGIGGAKREDLEWRSPADYLTVLEKKGVSTNVAALVGHGTVRNCVMGFRAGKPSPEELSRMKDLVRDAMEAGYFGMSTGLVYTPGVYADTDEIVELASVVGEYDGVYATHIRAERHVMEALDEALEVGKRAG